MKGTCVMNGALHGPAEWVRVESSWVGGEGGAGGLAGWRGRGVSIAAQVSRHG